MENREIAIQLSGVKKMYKLGQIGGGTLTADLQSWWARIRGKEDPNTKIGQEQRLVGQTFMALNGIDLTVYKGEALGIIGGNGAGKSTMLKLLSRVTAPTGGEIRINGRIASMLEVGTGFNPEMTGRENIYMNGAILGMTKAEIDAKMEEIIEFSEVREFIDTPVKRYSSGMYVKLAFSVAAHLDSEIMIMDEVLAVGDMAFQKKCLDKMRDASKTDGRTVLYVSHNMNTIRQLCDRCVVLDKGKVVFEGDTENAIEVYISNSTPVKREYEFPSVRTRKDIDRTVAFRKLRIIKGDDNLALKNDEPLHCEVSFFSNQSRENFALRLTIRSVEGTRAGMATTAPTVICKEGINKVELTLPATWLAPGKYCLDLIAYSVNEYGGDTLHDVIEEAFAFEKVVTNSQNNNMVWHHNWWGYVMFPEIDAKNME